MSCKDPGKGLEPSLPTGSKRTRIRNTQYTNNDEEVTFARTTTEGITRKQKEE